MKLIRGRRKYLLLIMLLTTIFVITLSLVFDFVNDKKYLSAQGFEGSRKTIHKYFTGYDNYCIPPSQVDNPTTACDIQYGGTILTPSLSTVINFGDGTLMVYSKEKKGIHKKEIIYVSIMNTEGSNEQDGLCQIGENFNIVKSDKNSDLCYTDKYTEYISKHKEYIDNALEKYNTYY